MLARDAALARDDDDYLDDAGNQTAASVVLVLHRQMGGRRASTPRGCGAASRVAGSRVVRRALGTLAGGRFVGFDHVEAVRALAADGRRARRSACRGSRPCGRVTSSCWDRSRPRGVGRGSRRTLSSFRCLFLERSVSDPQRAAPFRPSWDARRQRLDTGVRSGRPAVLRPGCRGRLTRPVAASRATGSSHPGSAGGARSCRTYLVDRKVPRDGAGCRCRSWSTGDDRIVWVVGQAVAEEFRVTDPSQGVILLKARRLGGQV